MALPPFRRSFDPEAAIARRREVDDRQRDEWSRNAAYYHDAEVQASKNQQWGSVNSFARSMDTWRQAAQQEENKTALMERRRRLRELLQTERVQHVAELRRIRPTHRDKLEAMRERSQTLRTQRESKRDQVAHTRRKEAWAANNPEVRDIKSEQLRDFVQSERAKQIAEKKEEAAWEAERRREEVEAKAQELERRERKERAALARKKEEAVAHQGELRQQMRELEQREAEAEALRKQHEAAQAEQYRLATEEAARQHRAATERQIRYSRSLRAQVKTQMLEKSRVVQEELERDLQLLARVAEAQAAEKALQTARRVEAEENVRWMRENMQQQLEAEKQKQAQLDALYRDEASRMFARQEARWDQERAARQKLMAEVFETRQAQLEDKLVLIEEQQRASIAEREALLYSIDQAKRDSDREAAARAEAQRAQVQDWQQQAAEAEAATESRRKEDAWRAEQERRREDALRADVLADMQTQRQAAFSPPRFGRRKVAWD